MKNIFYILLLLPTIIFAQYPSNSGQKITLGEQTTADGLVYRGVLADTGNITPFSDTSAYIILDTVNNRFYHYIRNTNVWTRLNLLPSDTTSFNYVNTYGTQTVNGTKTLTSNLILKNSQEPSRATVVATQTFAADTTNWTRGVGWTFNGTQAVATAATGDLTYTPALTITSGNAYEITYTVTSYIAGVLTVALGNVSLALPTHNATANVILLTPTSATGGFRFTTSTFTGNVDNVSIVEISKVAPVIFAGQDDASSTLYNSLRMPNSTTFAMGGGGMRSTSGNNIFFGFAAGQNNTTGNQNIFFNINSGQNNTTGSANNFFGSSAGRNNTTGSSNFFFGPAAGQNNTTGNNNNFYGNSAGLNNKDGSLNVFHGFYAGANNISGNNNIALGSNSLYNPTVGDTLTGINNIGFGTNAADNIKFAASGNVAIGNNIDLPDPSGSNQVVIKNIIYATGASGTGTISAGNVGIGTNAPTARLQVKGSGVDGNTTALKVDNNGNVNLLTILDNGFVGIGTPTPTTQMQLVGSTFSIIRVSSGAGNVSRFDFGTQSSPDIGRITFSNADSSIRIRPGLETSELSLLKNGNLGISVTTPTQKLHVVGNGLFTGSVTGERFNPTANTATGTGMYLPATNTLGFSTNGTNKLTINASGNLGLGVTPSVWGSGYKAIQNNSTSWFSTTSRDANFGTNVFVNSVGNYAYIETAVASLYTQFNGVHYWNNAPSGTAGTTLTFTQAMTLDASGRLGIGTASPAVQFHTTGDVRFAGLASITDLRTDADGDLFNGSDFNLKNSIDTINFGLSDVLKLKPVSFNWNDEQRNINEYKSMGFIAQDVMNVIPNAASTMGDGDMQVDYNAIVATLTKAIQEQQALIKALEQRIINLENK